MAIDEDTLGSWTSYENAAITSAKNTQEKIRNALENSEVLEDVEFETYLQGSYANYTIIPETSDVDIVVRLDDLFYLNYLDLDPEDQEDVEVEESDYGYWEFREDVLNVLQDTYEKGSFDPDGNAISVEAPGLDLDADILVCVRYIYYYNYPQGYYSGIIFWPTDSTASTVNYPNRHKYFGSKKQEDTEERFKETVRMFKNARNELIDEGYIQEGLAPSYFIECLLYNVPEGRYDSNLQDRYRKIVTYLQNTDFTDWKCQNRVTDLFGSGRTKWDSWHAKIFVGALWTYWENQNENEGLLNARLFNR